MSQTHDEGLCVLVEVETQKEDVEAEVDGIVDLLLCGCRSSRGERNGGAGKDVWKVWRGIRRD